MPSATVEPKPRPRGGSLTLSLLLGGALVFGTAVPALAAPETGASEGPVPAAETSGAEELAPAGPTLGTAVPGSAVPETEPSSETEPSPGAEPGEDASGDPSENEAAPAPGIAGTPSAPGARLRAVTGEWAPGTTFAYRWERLTEQGTATVAAAPEYALQAGDGGASLRVIVTGVQGDSAAVTRASEWLDVARFALAPATPIITGTPRVGQPLKATAGTWAPAGTATSAQWLRNGVAIPGATTLSYTPSAADATAKLTVRVTGSLPGYRSEHRDAAPVTITGLLTTATPGISGNLWAGQKVTATAGAWTAGTALSYQWLRNGTAITGATGSSYVLVAADSATRLTVRVTGTKSGYVTASAVSAQKTVLRTLAGATPKLSGTARSGQTLKAAVGTWTAGTTLKTQWLRNGAPIAGATGASYRLTNADSGTRVSVRVTGSRSGYATATKQSAARAVEARFASAPKPKVSGKPVIGATLTAQAGSWKPAPALKTQWLRNGAAISGATRGSYTLTAADVGKQLSVRVTATKAGYTAVTVQSASTGKVAKATTYQNCSALNRVYPNGVGKPGAKDRVTGGGKPVTSFFVSAQLYQANAKSDRDKDGIACEQR